MLKIADFGPGLAGEKRLGANKDVPGAIVSGYDSTSELRNSLELEVMFVTRKWNVPLL